MSTREGWQNRKVERKEYVVIPFLVQFWTPGIRKLSVCILSYRIFIPVQKYKNLHIPSQEVCQVGCGTFEYMEIVTPSG